MKRLLAAAAAVTALRLQPCEQTLSLTRAAAIRGAGVCRGLDALHLLDGRGRTTGGSRYYRWCCHDLRRTGLNLPTDGQGECQATGLLLARGAVAGLLLAAEPAGLGGVGAARCHDQQHQRVDQLHHSILVNKESRSRRPRSTPYVIRTRLSNLKGWRPLPQAPTGRIW